MADSPHEGQGSERKISRRDFLDGVAISAAGLAAAAASPSLTGAEAAMIGGRRLPRDYYPPTSTGIVGEPDDVIRDVMRIDGRPNPRHPHSTEAGPGIHPRHVRDVDDCYDLVVVGAGASGLAAAKWYQDRFGPDSKILLVDPLPDFGGHSHRNEFHIHDATNGGDVMLLRNGGTVNLDSIGTWNKPANGLLDIPGSYGQPALDMLAFCGVNPDDETFPTNRNSSIPSTYGLRPMLLFPKEDWGADSLVQAKQDDELQTWAEFLATTPYSPAAREGIEKIMTGTTDWIEAKEGEKSDQEKKAILARITYKQYLMQYVGASEEATSYFQRTSHGLFGAGIQAVQAGDTWALGEAGFDGLELEPTIFPGIGRTAQQDMDPDAEPSIAWPDGNSSLLRLLLSKLIPGAMSDVGGARPTQETIVQSRCDYSQLDRRRNNVRIRLNSTVVDVKPAGRHRDTASVTYVSVGGRRSGERVRAKHVVMACWNRVTARLVEGLPTHQIEALDYARKVPLVYCRVGLRNWQAFADAKISSVSPRGDSLFWDSTSLAAGSRFGSSYGPNPATPKQPAMLTLSATPNDPRATTQLESYERGRQQLLRMSFGDFERAIIDVIDRSVNQAGGDFEPERDIESIIVNRWNYGYAYELTSTFDPSLYGPNAQQPHVIGRKPYRNVTIANSDSGAFAYTHSAINEAYRAVQELP